MSELAFGGERLFVPALGKPAGARIRIRIDAQDVMLALTRPEGISANNVLAAMVLELRPGNGAYEDVLLAIGDMRLVARITRKSAARLNLTPGLSLFAVIKSVTVGGRDPR
jgi:molybdate transport system ATP-binding protein